MKKKLRWIFSHIEEDNCEGEEEEEQDEDAEEDEAEVYDVE